MTTAARPPQLDISLDTLPAQSSLRDYQRADAALVRIIEAQQHALACGWGTPPQVFGFNSLSPNGVLASLPVLLRVPPFCTRMRVCLLGAGAISYTFQVGALAATSMTLVAITTPGALEWTDGASGPSIGNQDGTLQVLAAQSPDWQTVAATLTRDMNYATLDKVFALAFYPILEQAV